MDTNEFAPRGNPFAPEEEKPVEDDKLIEDTQISIDSDDEEGGPQLLCVDINNYNCFFYNMFDHWDIDRPIQLIKEFVNCAKNSNFQLEIFVDAKIHTQETMKEWKGLFGCILLNFVGGGMGRVCPTDSHWGGGNYIM